MNLTELQQKLATIDAQIYDISTASYSQSNPSHMLGVRSLRRQKERLENAVRDYQYKLASVIPRLYSNRI